MMLLVQPKDEILLTPVDKLERLLDAQITGRERNWTENVTKALSNLENALRVHTAEVERSQGPFTSLSRPRMGTLIMRQVEKLRREHYDLLLHVQDLRQHSETLLNDFLPPAQQRTWTGARSPISRRGLRARGRRLVDACREHQHAETKLLQDSVFQDTGVSDNRG